MVVDKLGDDPEGNLFLLMAEERVGLLHVVILQTQTQRVFILEGLALKVLGYYSH